MRLSKNMQDQIPIQNWDGLQAPLSYAQRRMWFLYRIQPEQAAYINTSVFVYKGEFNLKAFEQAFNTIVERHAILRTTYTTDETLPVQVIHPYKYFDIPFIDLQHLTEYNRNGEIQRLIEHFSQQNINLSTDPPLKVIIIRSDITNHFVLWSIHHIATDGWSGGILRHELAVLYNAYCQNLPNPLLTLPIQYADYTKWQLGWLQADEMEQHLSYWRTQLRDLSVLELPTDYSRPSMQTYHRATQLFTVDEAHTAKIADFIRKERVTLYMVLLAAFLILLQRYTGQDDIAVGSPFANRNRKTVEGLIGFFVNTLVIRVNLRSVDKFTDLVKEIRNVTLGALMHQELPFEKLVEELTPERSLSHTPLVQVVFAQQNTPRPYNEYDGLIVESIPIDQISTRFDLECHIYESAQGLHGRIIYNRALFEPETIRYFAESYQTVIHQVSLDPERNLSEYTTLSASQTQKLIVEASNAEAPYPRDTNVCELFGAVVRKYPDKIAVIHHYEEMTYKQLNLKANKIAHYLVKNGVMPGTPVGLCMDRSINMVIAILGILKAGGCYVPIDPLDPLDRRSRMVGDTGIKLLVTQTHYLALFPESGLKVVDLDNLWSEITHLPSDNPDIYIDPLTPIYIMFTSGSTGRPKGILIPHRAVVRLVLNVNYVSLGRIETIAHGSNIAFDASTFELWGPLLNGGKVVILDRDCLLSPRQLEQELQKHAITTMFLTTALFNQTAMENPQIFESLHQLLFGGEAVTTKWVKAVTDNYPPQRLVHMYGPTEATTFATWYLVKDTEAESHTIPIGLPVSNTQVYVVDKFLHAIPAGAVGELCIAGDGLALGYLHQPGLTAEKFVPNPFSESPGARMYRTGDMVRWSLEGVLEYVGRTDQQVKIRGFRIELTEIELLLTGHPAIQQAIVAVHEVAGDKQLIAYIVENEDGGVENQVVRTYLKDKLPDYMIPAIYIRLSSLPMTPNGKIDRKRLPEPAECTDTSEDIQPPINNLELLLTNIWKSVLHLENINRSDNFFEIGGHSLLGVQMLDRLYTLTGKEIPVSVLYQAPTIAQMADVMRTHNWEPVWSSLVPLRLEGKGYPLFLVPPAGNTVLGFAHITNNLRTTQPILGLQYKGLDGKQMPYNRVPDIATHFIEEMRNYRRNGPYILGGFCFGAHVAFEMARQLQDMGDEVALVFILDASAPVSGPSWTGGRLVNKNFLYYIKRLLTLIRHKQLPKAVLHNLSILGHKGKNHILPVNNILTKHNKGIQQVFDANLEARLYYRAMPIKGKLVYITSELFYKFGYVPLWAELAPDDFSYEVFSQTTHRTLLLDREMGKHIAGIMQRYLDQLYDGCGFEFDLVDSSSQDGFPA